MKYTTEIIDIELIEPDPNQPRKKFDKEAITNLAKTIESQEIINPIEIDTNNIIITGEMRWRAAKEARLKKITVKRLTGLSETEIFERQVIENLHHNALSSKEKQEAVLKLWKSGKYKSREELAKRLGIDLSWVIHFIKLPKLKEELRVVGMPISNTNLYEIDRKIKDSIDRKKVAKKAVDENLTRDQIREVAKVIKIVPKDVKDEILKPKSEITLEEAKEIAEFPEVEQRKNIIKQIKQTKEASRRIIESKKIMAKEKPILAIIDVDEKFIETWNKPAIDLRIKWHKSYLARMPESTKNQCLKTVKALIKYLINEFKEEVDVIDG